MCQRQKSMITDSKCAIKGVLIDQVHETNRCNLRVNYRGQNIGFKELLCMCKCFMHFTESTLDLSTFVKHSKGFLGVPSYARPAELYPVFHRIVIELLSLTFPGW